MMIKTAVLVLGMLAAGVAEAFPPRVTPGPQPDGAMLLHNQWPIRPVGLQVPLGEFPVNLAVDPAGRYAAVLCAGYGPHGIEVIDLRSHAVVARVGLHEAFSGLALSADGRRLVCSGGSDGVLHVFGFGGGRAAAAPDVRVRPAGTGGVVCGVALDPDGRTAYASVLYESVIVRADLDTGRLAWTTPLSPQAAGPRAGPNRAAASVAPNAVSYAAELIDQPNPFGLAVDARRRRLYATLWGQSDLAVLDSRTGRLLARWPCGLHPNEVLLGRGGRRLFVSIGGRNAVAVLDAGTGRVVENLSSSLSPADPPGSTPDSLALSADGRTLFVANAYNDNVAVFDVGDAGRSRALGFIPTGWFPSSVRATRDGRRLLVVSARGLTAAANARAADGGYGRKVRRATVTAGLGGPRQTFPYIGDLYRGSLGIVDLPKEGLSSGTLRRWTRIAESCRPARAPRPGPDNPVPVRRGGPSPIRYVIYVIKENRTYDQVFGDLPEGDGDPSLCLFPERVTPNLHRIARQFVLLDNFYANAEVSASGHEWSMAGYASEFVEKTWPVNYGHEDSDVPYPGEGHYAAAVPALGYLWDRARAAGLSYRDYGEFAWGGGTPADPTRSDMPALRGHIDPLYRGWDLGYSDVDRAARFAEELHRFEAAGDMPRLQVVRLPNDHTQGATAGGRTPRALVAQNDLAVGRLIEAVSHSRFWPETALFIVEDDAQNGPDHVDAHREEALVVSPYVRHGTVDSTAYTTCSMLATIERILGLGPMSQFDAAAAPMWACFRAKPVLEPYAAVPNRVSLEERNPAGTPAAAASAAFDFSREDAIDDQAFNRVIWAAVRGARSPMPAPVHAAFVRPLPREGPDDD